LPIALAVGILHSGQAEVGNASLHFALTKFLLLSATMRINGTGAGGAGFSLRNLVLASTKPAGQGRATNKS
jgi:hypothetical protein